MAQDNGLLSWIGIQTIRCVPRTPLCNTATDEEKAQWSLDNAILQEAWIKRREARTAEMKLARLHGAVSKAKAKTMSKKVRACNNR